MDKLDTVNAPQWADFDASVRSDIDEYFNFVHEDLEPEQLGDLQYHSCPSTPNTKKPIAESPYKTPKSDSSSSSQELSSYIKNLQIKEENSLRQGKMSITPRTYVLKKTCSRLTRSSSRQIVVNEPAKSSETPKKHVTNSNQKSPEDGKSVIKCTKSPENLESTDNEEEENADHNCTLIATEESKKNSSNECDSNDCDQISAEPPSKETGKAEHCIVETKNNETEPALEEPKDSMIPTVFANTDISKGVILPPEEPEKEEKVQKANECKVKSVKLQSQVDPLKHAILNNRKNLQGKPTVLTSHARRQSTSRYRRVSNKYISLAEAVSKFQNGTPERFRSANRKDAKGSNAPGPLQKVKKTALKVTCAISPVLRCKYRSRATSVLNQGERETLKVEKIHKNGIKPNTIKQVVKNSQKNLKTTSTVLESTTKLKKTTVNDSMKKVDKKQTTDTEALPSTQIRAINNGPRLLKKSDESTKNDNDLSSRPKTTMNPAKIGERVKKASSIADPQSSLRRTMMNPPKAGELMKKSSSIPDPPSSHSTMINLPKAGEAAKKSSSTTDSLSSRRTMMNPPKAASIKTKESTKNSNASLSDRRTMMNPPKAPLQISGKSTKMPEPFPLKASLNPSEVVKKFDNELKPHTAGSTSFLDKTSTGNILSTTILSESVRRNTPCKKVIQTVVSTDGCVSIKDEEISYFGIPVGNAYKKITEAIPFSFESHKKQQTQAKKDPLKNRQNREEKKTKTFHARPVPSYVINPSLNPPKHPSKPPVMADAPFSFQQRDENLLKKKKELFDQIVEREKKNRVFHARPAPKFKPVFVRGVSSENLRTNNAAEKQTKLSNETRRRSLSQDAIADDRENTEPNVVTNNQPFPKLKIPLTTTLNRKFKKIVVS